jgi:hypothetical protein
MRLYPSCGLARSGHDQTDNENVVAVFADVVPLRFRKLQCCRFLTLTRHDLNEAARLVVLGGVFVLKPAEACCNVCHHEEVMTAPARRLLTRRTWMKSAIAAASERLGWKESYWSAAKN